MNQISQPAQLLNNVGLTSKGFASAMSEAGKSTIGRAWQRVYSRCLVIDTLNEYKDEHRIIGLLNLNAELKKVKYQDRFRLVFAFPLGASDKVRDFDFVCRMVFETTTMHLNIEEVHHYCSPSSIGYWHSLLHTGGRHNNVSVYSSSQRFAKVHNDIVSQAHHKYVGQLDNHRDFAAAAEYFPDDAVRALTRYNFLHKYNNEISAFNTQILRSA